MERVSLENKFDRDDRCKLKDTTSNTKYEEVNIGSQEYPCTIKVCKILDSRERKEVIDLVREFRDLFAWSYNNKNYDKNIIQHAIPLEENVKPHLQKLRKVNPKLALLVKKKLEKMVEAKITVPIRYSEWISNPAPSRKKAGDVKM